MTFLKTVSPTFKSVGKSIESSKRAKRVKKNHIKKSNVFVYILF